ncbi:MAG: RNA 2',3'-cyclic phosphodiesterase [Elusimicrobia bacterium]|nr:RNA 2',3'-cyclic phosphodiesterase [Elusimicrobiota bacterium]
MRAFIAAEIPPAIQEGFSFIQKRLHYSGAVIKWVKPSDIHFTLRFLGEVKEDKIGELCGAVENALRGIQPFTVSFGGLGSFPEHGYPRVIWAGIKEGADELGAIAEGLRDLPEGCGEPAEKRRFAAHATLGRVKENRNITALRRSLEDPGTAEVITGRGYILRSLTLMRTAPGPLYTPLMTFSLTTI